MITPRLDPETAPVLAGYQLRRRSQTNRYGQESSLSYGAKTARNRPVSTRNGLPVRWYVYRGSGESMTSSEAGKWLTRA